MTYEQMLQDTIDFIERHITESLTLDLCAKQAGFSKYHFYRLFGLYTGQSLMEYVRSRKMSYAMLQVSEGRRLLDIAMDFGYGSERAFSRAFIKHFVKTPSQYRKTAYKLPEKLSINSLSVEPYGGKKMEQKFSAVRMETLKTMFVASSVVISNNPEDEVIAKMNLWADNRGISKSARRFGFDVPVSDGEQVRGIRGYEYWICVKEGTTGDGDIVIKKIEAGQYAVLRITDPFEDPFAYIPQGWKQLVAAVNAQNLRAPERECYWLEEVFEEEGITYMDLYFPVQ